MSTLPNPLLASMAAANPPALGTSIAMPGSAPSMGSSVLPSVSLAPPTQTQKDMTERDRIINTGSGVSQIHNPLLRGIARAADIAGSVFAPNLAQFIPGTTLHHQLTMGQAAQNVATDQAEEQATAQTANEAATTAHTNAATDALQNPNDKFTPIQTDSGFASFDPKTGKATPVLGPDGTQVGTPDKTKAKTPEQAAYDAEFARTGDAMKAFTAVKQASNTKDASFQQQFLDAYQKAHPEIPLTDAIAATIRATSTQPKIDVHAATEKAPGTMLMVPDGKGSMVATMVHPGDTVAPNATTASGMGAAGKAADKQTQMYQQIVEDAQTSHQLAAEAEKGNAPADVDLALAFFKAMKGSGSGIRFTQAEQNLIMGARSSAGDLQGIAQKVIGEGQKFTPDQRNKILKVIDIHAAQAQKHLTPVNNAEPQKTGATADPLGIR